MKLPSAQQVAAAIRRPKTAASSLSKQLRAMVINNTRWSRQKQMALLDLADDLAEHGL